MLERAAQAAQKHATANRKLLGFWHLTFSIYKVVNLQSNIKNMFKNLILLSK